MLDCFSALLLLVVATLWGTTNALMKKCSEGIEKCESQSASWIRNWFEEIKFIAKNWRYLSVYGVNQCGSLIYYYALGYCDLAIAGPLTNVMTFVVTYFADGYFFKDNVKSNKYQKAGIVLICVGILICLSA
jgi:drug/metabolite transporter (DMT)-like permease